MLEWASRWIWWIVSRCTVTLICIIVVQSVLHEEGYLVPFKNLTIGAAALIMGVYVWMRGPRPAKPKPEMSWGEREDE